MFKIFEQLLQKNKITANKFSKLSGIPQATLSDWKNGRSIPKIDKLQIIADYFNVSLEYLTGKTDIKKQPTIESELSDRQKYAIELFGLVPEDKLAAALEYLEFLAKDKK